VAEEADGVEGSDKGVEGGAEIGVANGVDGICVEDCVESSNVSEALVEGPGASVGLEEILLEEGLLRRRLLDTIALLGDCSCKLEVITGVLAMVDAMVLIAEGDVAELLPTEFPTEFAPEFPPELSLSCATGSVIAFPVPQHVLFC
jgi:hypothetical protein